MNIYYNPEKFGLEIVASLDLGGGYEYDTYLVFKKDGKLYSASDSGCSCYEPFDGIGVEDLDELTWENFSADMDDWSASIDRDRDKIDIDLFRVKVLKLMTEMGL